MPLKLKLDENGNAVLKEVNGAKQPVYVHDDGKELPFDADDAVTRIKTYSREAQTHREAKEALEAQVKAFTDAGLTDVEAAKKALEVVKNLDDKKLVDAGKVEEVRAAAVRTYEERLQAQATTHANALRDHAEKNSKLEQQLQNEIIGGAFARSKFIAERVAIPADMVQAAFGRHFKVEDGKLAAYDVAGNRIHSRERPGDPNVSFEEAIEIVVDAYPHRASILKGTQARGSGAGEGGGNGGGGAGKRITRAAYEALPPAERAVALKDAQLVD